MAEKIKKAMIVSVGTCMKGRDIAHGICFSIQQQNPDLLVFLTTTKSKETTMPFIREDCDFKGRHRREVNLTDPDDVEKITLDCQDVIKGLIKDGYNLADVVVDYTSGTKAMSAGLCMASIRKRVGTLTYISGKRGIGGKGRVRGEYECSSPFDGKHIRLSLWKDTREVLIKTCLPAGR